MQILLIALSWSLIGVVSIVIGDYIDSTRQFYNRRMLAQDICWGVFLGWFIPAMMFVVWVMDQEWWNQPAFKERNKKRSTVRR